jgi:hypothetical protein
LGILRFSCETREASNAVTPHNFKHRLPQLLESAERQFEWTGVYGKILELGWKAEDVDTEFQ